MPAPRSEPEAICDAASLIALSEEDKKLPEVRADVHELLIELHDIGTPACLEAARRLARRYV